MIFIDGEEYINYKEICKEFNIDYNDFENYMNKNKNISQYELQINSRKNKRNPTVKFYFFCKYILKH